MFCELQQLFEPQLLHHQRTLAAWSFGVQRVDLFTMLQCLPYQTNFISWVRSMNLENNSNRNFFFLFGTLYPISTGCFVLQSVMFYHDFELRWFRSADSGREAKTRTSVVEISLFLLKTWPSSHRQSSSTLWGGKPQLLSESILLIEEHINLHRNFN